MHTFIKISMIFFLTSIATLCFGQIESRFVRPVDTDPNYDPDDNRHAVIRNPDTQLDTLYLFFGGTGSNSELHYTHLGEYAAELGFDVVNLNYRNGVATFSLTNDPDSLAFDHYRQEICFGTPASDDISVDTLNSIFIRTLNLIKYLDQNFPSEDWGKYLASPVSLDWSRIIVGGHSQGSGHAAFLAKRFLVGRVLMFSGPNDYSNFFQNAAHWIRQDGMTPVESHFAYLHLKDEVVDFDKQYLNITGLGMTAISDTTLVDNNTPPYHDSHCLFTTQEPFSQNFYHNVTALPGAISSLNEAVWEYMLTSRIPTTVKANKPARHITVFPNPASTVLYIGSPESGLHDNFTIWTMAGQAVLAGSLSTAEVTSVDISGLEKGAYVLCIGNAVAQIFKQ